MYDITKLENTLQAGAVQRYHATPMVASQSIAEHSWNVAIIYMELSRACKSTSDATIIDALFHDVAELYTGDVPFTVKREFPPVKDLYDQMEEKFMVNFIKSPASDRQPHDTHKFLLKLADWLEGLRWCSYYEHGFGKPVLHNYAEGLVSKWNQYIEDTSLPAVLPDVVDDLRSVVSSFFDRYSLTSFPVQDPADPTSAYVDQ